jgi:hypothetical protein
MIGFLTAYVVPLNGKFPIAHDNAVIDLDGAVAWDNIDVNFG